MTASTTTCRLETDDLLVITFNLDGTILSDVKMADISGNAHSWTFNGDIASRTASYGWGLCGVSGHGYDSSSTIS
jgi:hypothetical protein